MPYYRQDRKKVRDWDPEDMLRAVTEVREGRLSLRLAAAKFGVPKSSLNERVSGRVAFGCLYDQKPLLSPTDENALLFYCLYGERYGFTLTKPEVLSTALILYNQRHPEAQKKSLGQTWWINFRERHHETLKPIPDIIDHETSEVTEPRRAVCTKSKPIREYFKLLQSTVDELGLRDRVQQIYSCAETTFPLGGVNWVEGSQYFHKTHTNKQITVLACFNAAGEDVPPLIVYKAKYSENSFNNEGFPNAVYGRSQTGLIDGELFHRWFVECFLNFASRERPLLLVMDGHRSHLGPEVVQTAERAGVILLGLPPHSSNLLQPLEKHFFQPLKADFYESVRFSRSRSFFVSKLVFSKVLMHQYDKVKSQGIVVTGFRRCGLFPLDPDAIDWSQVLPSEPQREKASAPPADLRPQIPFEDVVIIEDTEEEDLDQEEEQPVPLSAVSVNQLDVQIDWSPESSLKQEIPETQKEEQFPPQTSSKTENIIISNVLSLRKVNKKHNVSTPQASKITVDRNTYEINSASSTSNDEVVTISFAQKKKDVEGDHNNQVQIKDTNATAHTSAPETSTNIREGHITGAGAVPLECFLCTERFFSRYGLAEHVKKIHEGARSYSCSVCHRKFSSVAGRKKHKTLHTKENR